MGVDSQGCRNVDPLVAAGNSVMVFRCGRTVLLL